jgi:hypothetical protein
MRDTHLQTLPGTIPLWGFCDKDRLPYKACSLSNLAEKARWNDKVHTRVFSINKHLLIVSKAATGFPNTSMQKSCKRLKIKIPELQSLLQNRYHGLNNLDNFKQYNNDYMEKNGKRMDDFVCAVDGTELFLPGNVLRRLEDCLHFMDKKIEEQRYTLKKKEKILQQCTINMQYCIKKALSLLPEDLAKQVSEIHKLLTDTLDRQAQNCFYPGYLSHCFQALDNMVKWDEMQVQYSGIQAWLLDADNDFAEQLPMEELFNKDDHEIDPEEDYKKYYGLPMEELFDKDDHEIDPEEIYKQYQGLHNV